MLKVRNESESWREIADSHPPVKVGKRKTKPSVGSIRRAFTKVANSPYGPL